MKCHKFTFVFIFVFFLTIGKSQNAENRSNVFTKPSVYDKLFLPEVGLKFWQTKCDTNLTDTSIHNFFRFVLILDSTHLIPTYLPLIKDSSLFNFWFNFNSMYSKSNELLKPNFWLKEQLQLQNKIQNPKIRIPYESLNPNLLLNANPLLLQKMHIKNKYVAGTLSIIPGLGKIYLGRVKDGFAVMGSVLVNTFGAIYSFKNLGNAHPVPYIFAAIASGFYIGSIVGTQSTFKKQKKVESVLQLKSLNQVTLEMCKNELFGTLNQTYNSNLNLSNEFKLFHNFLTADTLEATKAVYELLQIYTSNNFTRGVVAIQRGLAASKLQDSVKADISILGFKYAYKIKNFELTQFFLKNAQNFAVLPADIALYNWICLYEQGNYTSCLTALNNATITFNNMDVSKQYLQKLINKTKNPKKAYYLAIIPGLGYAYTGNGLKALNSLALLGGVSYVTQWTWKNVHPLNAVFIGLFSTRWYFGGMKNSAIAAKKYNQKIRNKYRSVIIN